MPRHLSERRIFLLSLIFVALVVILPIIACDDPDDTYQPAATPICIARC